MLLISITHVHRFPPPLYKAHTSQHPFQTDNVHQEKLVERRATAALFVAENIVRKQ